MGPLRVRGLKSSGVTTLSLSMKSAHVFHHLSLFSRNPIRKLVPLGLFFKCVMAASVQS